MSGFPFSIGDAARRIYRTVTRGTLVKPDDSKKMQELTVRDFFGDVATNVEHWHPYGLTTVPQPPDGKGEPEALVLYVGGNPDHPVVLAVADRRHRPKNLKPGESAQHDDQKQHVHLTRSGINATGKKFTATAGDKPETANHELNEQLKGLRADISQVKDSHHALFDAVSKLRVNAESVLPALAPINLATQITGALNGQAAGLDAMKALASGKLQDLFQNALKDALLGFLDPSRITSATSLLSGGVEGLIAAAKAQIADLIANNPVIGIVDDLRDELAAVQASGGAPAIVAAKAAELQAQIAGHASQSPVLAQVANIRSTLDGFMNTAGPGLNFLDGQKRLAQGQTRSLRLGGPG